MNSPDANTQNGPSPCGLGRRLLVMAYDATALLPLFMLVAALFRLTPLGDQIALRDPALTATLTATWFLYLAWCWRRGGLTLGMRAWRVRLISGGGESFGWGRCLIRFAVSLASAAALGAGFAWAWTNPQRNTWHDLASSSRLVRVSGSGGSPQGENRRHGQQ